MTLTLLDERQANLPPDQALGAAADVLATASPATWDHTCQEISHRLGIDEDTTRRELHRAVRAWHDNPHQVATQQLDNAREVRARLQVAAQQTPEERWADVATELDPRLPQQQDWPALAAMMQHLHNEGHDVETLARASVTDRPLAPARPAQDLRYRLALIAPPIQEISSPFRNRAVRRPEAERRGPTPSQNQGPSQTP